MIGTGSADPVIEVRRALAAAGGPVLVALSGGRDSLVLLHILRFHISLPAGLVAVHVDHGMRRGSDADARWLRGLCRAWGVPLRVVRLDPAPRSEAEARTLRYRVLREEARGCGARRVLVAHHAEDQAETILFRILRGTGPRGLAGIPPRRTLERSPAPTLLVRPLLRVPGRQIEAWARSANLRPREDPTNRNLRYRRNRIRHHLLPRLEAGAPGFRKALLALGEAARGREHALERILTPAVEHVVVARDRDRISFARNRFLEYREPVRAELLRRLAREGGANMSRRGLALGLEFSGSAQSGKAVTVGPGLRLVRDFDALVLEFGAPRPGRAPTGHGAPGARGRGEAERVSSTTGAVEAGSVRLEGPGGEARFAPGSGRQVRVWWRLDDGEGEPGNDSEPGAATPGETEVVGSSGSMEALSSGRRTTFPASLVEAPLEFRGRRPGDRVRLHLGPGPEGGAPALRKLKKLLGEARVSRDARDHLPLLVDARGWVIWIPGVWRTRVPATDAGPRTWTIGVIDASNFA
ncbi:hypothetical protein BH23GEM11_BH23GEM11_20950 [soil metagenome]